MKPSARHASSLEALTELLDLRPTSGADRTRLGVVAGRSGPRFLVPLDFPEASPQACWAYLGLRDRKTQLARGAVGLALRTGLHRLVVRDDLTADTGPGSLIALLEELLEDPEEEPGLAIAAGLSRIDEVWKPTLQVFRPDGTPAAFVKIGLGPVGDRLVGTEAETLAAWADHPDPRLVVPDLIADARWNGLRIAVVAPLPDDARRLPPGATSAWAVRALDGPEEHGPLTTAPWWTGRRRAWADEPAVDALLDAIEQRHGGSDRAWARWHGDWVPWNLARCHRGLVAWDWEYSEPGAPVGLDEVHGAYQQARVVEGRSIADSLLVARTTAHHLGARMTTGMDAAVHHEGAAARWLSDAHVAMLVTRSAELERLTGEPPAHQPELLAAARDAVAVP
ncbi:MAG TPA: hypothetical protein VNQ33_12745 [Acidimicrobiales bacterium]|nr:hypothetical protein [Acidimicrobiales bacterium]